VSALGLQPAVEMEAKLGMVMTEDVSEVSQGPRLGALGVGKSPYSGGTMRRQIRPCLSLYFLRSFFFFLSKKSSSLELLFLCVDLSKAAGSSGSVALSNDCCAPQ